MPVRPIHMSAGTFHQGFSAVSGFRTRLLHSPEQAQAEEEWLDNLWHDLRKALIRSTELRDESLRKALFGCAQVTAIVAGRGVFRFPIRQYDQELHSADVQVWCSSDEADPLRFLVWSNRAGTTGEYWPECQPKEADAKAVAVQWGQSLAAAKV